MNLYDVRATLSNGDIPDGAALSAWLNMNADHMWGWANVENMRCQLLIEIRLASTGSVIDSATITISTTANYTDLH